MDVHRITVDLPVELNEAVNAAVKRTHLSKAQYMRMSLEVLGLLAGMKGELYFVHAEDGRRERVLVPGVIG